MNLKQLYLDVKKNLIASPDNSILVEKSGQGILEQKGFHDMLEVERKRVKRSRTPFLLMLIELRYLRTILRKKTGLQRFYDVIKDSCREIDHKGWYDYCKVFGIIYTEVHSDASSTISARMRNNLTNIFGDAAAAARISTIYYPEKYDTEADRKIVEYLYPELMEPSVPVNFSGFVPQTIEANCQA